MHPGSPSSSQCQDTSTDQLHWFSTTPTTDLCESGLYYGHRRAVWWDHREARIQWWHEHLLPSQMSASAGLGGRTGRLTFTCFAVFESIPTVAWAAVAAKLVEADLVTATVLHFALINICTKRKYCSQLFISDMICGMRLGQGAGKGKEQTRNTVTSATWWLQEAERLHSSTSSALAWVHLITEKTE